MEFVDIVDYSELQLCDFVNWVTVYFCKIVLSIHFVKLLNL